MLARLLLSVLFALVLAPASLAAAPRVVTDIAPVHALVARVMQGAGTPELLVTPGASAHGHAMRPGQAQALASADLVVWVGPELTPWIGKALATLAPDTARLALADLPETRLLPLREAPVFDLGHNRTERAPRGGVDPHVWLDPRNAQAWVGPIADRLAALDPSNAEVYAANAEAARAELDRLIARMEDRLAPLRGRPFLVAHDGWQYFEERFGLNAVGALTPADESRPGAARLVRLRETVEQNAVACLLADPQTQQGYVAAAFGEPVPRIAVADPLGGTLEPGPDLYGGLMLTLADALTGCLDG